MHVKHGHYDAVNASIEDMDLDGLPLWDEADDEMTEDEIRRWTIINGNRPNPDGSSTPFTTIADYHRAMYMDDVYPLTPTERELRGHVEFLINYGEGLQSVAVVETLTTQ